VSEFHNITVVTDIYLKQLLAETGGGREVAFALQIPLQCDKIMKQKRPGGRSLRFNNTRSAHSAALLPALAAMQRP
jgi:hypothetical protein